MGREVQVGLYFHAMVAFGARIGGPPRHQFPLFRKDHFCSQRNPTTMDQTDESTPTIPTLRLITDLNSTLHHHCSLCQFFHGINDEHCNHHRPQRKTPRPPPSQTSDESFYSAQTSHSVESTSSQSTVKAQIKPTRRPDSPTLRHKLSPTKMSLRDLRQQQCRQTELRKASSDERLREMYEAQILSYLGGRCVTLDRVEE